MLVMATDAARGDRNVSKHCYRSSDVCRIEELRIAGLAKPLEMFGLLASKQVRLCDRVIGSEIETKRSPRFLQSRRRFAQEQRRKRASSDGRLPPFLVKLQACLRASADDLCRPECAHSSTFSSEDSEHSFDRYAAFRGPAINQRLRTRGEQVDRGHR